MISSGVDRLIGQMSVFEYVPMVAERHSCCSGNATSKIYHPVIDKETGHFELEIDKLQTKHTYEEIQSYKDSVDMHKIIERFRAGDQDVLSRVQGFYADLTSVPRSIFEAMEMQQRVNEHFASLPPEIKERFGNNPIQYTLQAGTDEWFSKMHLDKKDVVAATAKKEDVSSES